MGAASGTLTAEDAFAFHFDPDVADVAEWVQDYWMHEYSGSDLHFVERVAIDGTTMLVGVSREDAACYPMKCDGCDAGSVRVYEVSPNVPFIRSDSNADGVIDLADCFSEAEQLLDPTIVGCRAALAVNGDSSVAIDDVIFSLNYQFFGGLTIPKPTSCGRGSIPGDWCVEFDACP